MAHAVLLAAGHVVQDNLGVVFWIGFLPPLLTAYWFIAVLPYRSGRAEDALAPRDLGRPAVPGVLEQYATWEWASRDPMTPLGAWLAAELARQNRSLTELARESGLDVADLRALLYARELSPDDLAMVRWLAMHLGASPSQIGRFLPGTRQPEVEAHRHP